MREGLVVAGETFATKKALEERLKAMLHAAAPGVELDEPEHSFLLCVLFRHPDAVEKIGCGVRAFRVGTSKYGNRCFEAVRTDGTWTEFSYLKCAKGSEAEFGGSDVEPSF
jgi:hypothetical protein